MCLHNQLPPANHSENFCVHGERFTDGLLGQARWEPHIPQQAPIIPGNSSRSHPVLQLELRRAHCSATFLTAFPILHGCAFLNTLTTYQHNDAAMPRRYLSAEALAISFNPARPQRRRNSAARRSAEAKTLKAQPSI